jgi:hypothetical protein
LNVAGLVLIGSARLSRIHFKIKSLLNSYRAGAHCDLETHDVSALFSAGPSLKLLYRLRQATPWQMVFFLVDS